MAIYDVSVAFFHASIDEGITVIPPPGTARAGYVWILLKAMYGTRRAAQLWQEHLATVLKTGNWRADLQISQERFSSRTSTSP